MSNPQIIGITGGIGTGKTFVIKYLKKLTKNTLNSDTIAHDLLKNDHTVKKILVRSFGEKIIDINGDIDRKILGKIVFNDKIKLNLLNKLLEPFLYESISNALNLANKPVFIEIPLLYELNYEKMVDKVILVYASSKTAESRIQKRDNISIFDAKKRIESQMPIEKKISKADYVINTEIDNVDKQIINILQKMALLN